MRPVIFPAILVALAVAAPVPADVLRQSSDQAAAEVRSGSRSSKA